MAVVGRIFALLLVLLVPLAAWAEAVAIGVPAAVMNSPWLSGSDPASFVLRNSITEPLVRVESGGRLRFALAGALQRSPAQGTVKIKVRSTAYFHNGRPVQAEDLVFSVERCIKLGGLPPELRIEIAPGSADWVTLSGAEESRWLEGLSQCPIVEKQSGELFGATLGTGTNLVASGLYRIVDTGREVLLAHPGGKSDAGPEKIAIHAFPDPRNGLTALRSGTIDLLFSEDPETLERAQKDETLSVSKCSIYMVIYRRGFNLQCEPFLDVSAFGYRG